ncbi:hypothetical protein D1818_18725 [Aquimarina sp. BL5]|uniref:hypothetical protein n=1 Tax=Aquimarina sp. BL5 TaxID=1714860 RepID=UPI000E53DFB8|nr:hypothetical protein [Aquimarina sp. BL5]AXT52759.1 hypothetical protein D1818_18725 [Aquimarina sp. BL5]RKN09904.1 hypothetical protein D7036_03790 [Aquimarina sp. BL5]
MSKTNLANTKQGKQITELRNQLEKSGWTIIEEIEREFKGKPRWELNDKTPNLIYSWSIRRNPVYEPIWLDFIAWWDYMTYETYINDCTHCIIRNTEIQLDFNKDRNLRNENIKLDWKNNLKNFVHKLNGIEKNKKSI